MNNTDRHLALLAQEALKARGFNPGPLDGLWGEKTEAAWIKFRESYVFTPEVKPKPITTSTKPAWLIVAEGELGIAEVPGAKDNPRIVEYHQSTTLKATDDETPWCAAFVGWCLEQAGVRGTRSASARSFLDWGNVLSQPQRGCIVVFRRGQPPNGHVAFFLDSEGSTVTVLGGNQGDKVKTAVFSRSDVLGYRWPKAA